jgi:hypothetical protein
MLLEDFNMDNPDLQPWDPRIKEIAIEGFPASMHHGYQDAIYFKIYLHCKRKLGSAITVEAAQELPFKYVMDMLRADVQGYIDDEYKKLQKMAGGSVDIYGHPIMTINKEFFPMWEDSNLHAISSGLKVAQLTDEEQYQAWCKQAANLEGSLENIKTWTPTGYTIEGFTLKPPAETGSIVQRNLKRLFPGLIELVTCPVCKNENATMAPQQMQLDRAIIHLNDTHKWSREAVADWLESLDVDIAMKEENV